ncbi:toxin-activating lysine-acyltransferase [Pseudooceanicola sp.]|uniref:toxin-activating lysine-acyltransferase n=1 Tax=Pseudooceanicola sp. TaxID=1914328 RepID=UPI0035C69D36
MAKKTTKTEAADQTDGKNGSETKMADASQIDPDVAKKINQLRSALRENFGKVVMALMMMPRYRSQMLGDLQHLVLDPMLHDRIAIAYPNAAEKSDVADMAGFGIWASVSEEVDAKIREQISSGVFPIRLKPDEWNSGNINWLLDVVAQDRSTITTVIANFRQVVKEGELRLHPLITRLVDPEVLEKMGAKKTPEGAGASD